MTNRSKRKTPQRKSILRNKKLVAVPILSVIVIVSISLASYTLLQTPSKFSLKAAIIDQLGDQFPNATFIETTTHILTDAGFNTTYYESQAVNVSFYETLAEQNYGIIILRSHSALRYPNNDTVDLFTSEEFNNQSYRQMWAEGYLSEGQYSPPFISPLNKTYFAITPDFIENIKGNFPRSIVIAMGCWSLKTEAPQLAKAFHDKGAEAYIGWTSVILPKDTDTETTNLLAMLVNQDRPLAQAVALTKSYTYPVEGSINKTVSTRLDFLPKTEVNLTLSELIATVKTSQSTASLNNSQNSVSLIAKSILRQRNPLNGIIRQTLQAAGNA